MSQTVLVFFIGFVAIVSAHPPFGRVSSLNFLCYVGREVKTHIAAQEETLVHLPLNHSVELLSVFALFFIFIATLV
ncbi:hypothetical protein Y032_0006g2838 [Ancylostoma ceylanicum]|uniref:Uncharacterized protein n=1 Tax=Ancylostoma ceylanicum TaxID=53326 RepID=A0A016VPG0_9BILA|nr:hypothetical protein Y032_0006g2838 [Ancylostoma ceylanicum]